VPNQLSRGLVATSAVRFSPVLPLEVPDSCELPFVRRDERRSPPPRLAGEQNIVRANRLAGRFEFGPDGSGLSGVCFIELRPHERAGEECLEPLRVALFLLALSDTVPEFESDNRRQEHHVALSHRTAESATHTNFGAVDQRDARICIKKVSRHRTLPAWA